MKRLLVFLLFLVTRILWGELAWVPDQAMQLVFAGRPQRIQALFHNPATRLESVSLRARLAQVTSATAVTCGEIPLIPFQAGPDQTVVACAVLTIPQVKAASRFLVQWIGEGNRVLGLSDIMAYPDNLLEQLPSSGGRKSLLLFDPQNQLYPLLNKAKVEFTLLSHDDQEKCAGKLAIILPAGLGDFAPAWLAERVVQKVKSGMAAVWFEPSLSNQPPLEPSSYSLKLGEGFMIIAQARTVINLTNSPLSQLNLIRLVEWATHQNHFGPPPMYLKNP